MRQRACPLDGPAPWLESAATHGPPPTPPTPITQHRHHHHLPPKYACTHTPPLTLQGICHLDVKSANLLLATDGSTKLADMGFACALNSCDAPVGTFAWCAARWAGPRPRHASPWCSCRG